MPDAGTVIMEHHNLVDNLDLAKNKNFESYIDEQLHSLLNRNFSFKHDSKTNGFTLHFHDQSSDPCGMSTKRRTLENTILNRIYK